MLVYQVRTRTTTPMRALLLAGQTVDYTVTLYNKGNARLRSVGISPSITYDGGAAVSSTLGAWSCSLPSNITVQDQRSCTATFTFSIADIEAGDINFGGTVSATAVTPASGISVASPNVTVLNSPSLTFVVDAASCNAPVKDSATNNFASELKIFEERDRSKYMACTTAHAFFLTIIDHSRLSCLTAGLCMHISARNLVQLHIVNTCGPCLCSFAAANDVQSCMCICFKQMKFTYFHTWV